MLIIYFVKLSILELKCNWTEPKAQTGLPFWHSHQGTDAVNTHTWFTCMVSWLPTVMPICSDGIMPTQVAQGNICWAVIGLGKYFSNWVGVDLLLGRPKRKRKQKEFSFFTLMDCFHFTFSKNTTIYKTFSWWFADSLIPVTPARNRKFKCILIFNIS